MMRIEATQTSADISLSQVDVIIPALNEEQSLPLVLGDLPPVRRVVVVDNGSTDATAQIAREHGATVIHEPQRGYGAACLAGIAEIKRLAEQGKRLPDVVVFVDADFSDHPDELPHLVQPILENRADLVIGSRLLGQSEPGAMPPQARYGNRLACFLMWILLGHRFTDLGPFRAIRYQALDRLNMTDQSFGWTIEMQIKAVQANLRIQEVPVSYRRRVGVSKISGTVSGTIRAGSKILWTIAKYRWVSFL